MTLQAKSPDCPFYDDCLHLALEKKWPNWQCKECSYHKPAAEKEITSNTLNRQTIIDFLSRIPAGVVGRMQAFGIKPKYSLAEVSFIFRATEEVVCAKVATGEITGQGWRDIINYVMRYPRETFELPAEKELKTIFDLLHHHHLHHHHVPDKIVSRIQTVGIKPKYSLSEVSFILGVSHETVRIKVITGEIVGRKIGGGKRAQSWNIHLPDLVNYLIKKKN